LLRRGEEWSGALPDRVVPDPDVPGAEYEVAGEEADDAAGDVVPEVEDGGPSPFARDWIARLEADG
jgi:hypothetical protein